MAVVGHAHGQLFRDAGQGFGNFPLLLVDGLEFRAHLRHGGDLGKLVRHLLLFIELVGPGLEALPHLFR